MTVPFEANQGQFAPEVAYAAHTFAGTLFVTHDGRMVHALAGKPQLKGAEYVIGAAAIDQRKEKPTGESGMERGFVPGTPVPRGRGWALVESMYGAGNLAPRGRVPSDTHVNRFSGGAVANQPSSIATFERVHLGEPWPGVSVELAARGGNVEKLFTVAPGTNPRTIRMNVAGAKRLQLGSDGSLIAATGNGDIAFTPPVAFQQIGGTHINVPVSYVLADKGYRFETGRYDRSQPLVIDPLLQSTYLGGSGNDQAYAMALDASGIVLVAGLTQSTNFPGVSGGGQTTIAGNADAFVARISNNLQTLVQATYLGGSGTDAANALSIDTNGNVFVAGYTNSTNFPGTAGGAQPANGGVANAFVARLSSDLQTLANATYLGGNGYGQAYALRLDAGGNVLVAGYTSSPNFPNTVGGAQPVFGGDNDAFVARLSSNLATLQQATYLGGSGNDNATAIVLDASGNVLIAGYTSTNFPGTSDGAQPTSPGGGDGFVARLSGNLATSMQATYLGGAGIDGVSALAIDGGGNVLVAGGTTSTAFPGTTGGAQAAIGGGTDAYVARLSSNLGMLVKATYLGGNFSDHAYALALDAAGNIFVTGNTESTNFPGTIGGALPANGGDNDAFVARLSSNLGTLVQATYLGGNADETGYALALDPSGDVLVAGPTQSYNFPGSTGGVQVGNGGGGAGGNDAFIAKLTADLQVIHDSIFANGFE